MTSNSFTIEKIHFTNTNVFVLKYRNKENSRFFIVPKDDFIRQMELEKGKTILSTYAGFKDESEIIEMIESGKKFYTYSDDEFTDVTIVNGNLKSVKNGTTKDNIGELPISN